MENALYELIRIRKLTRSFPNTTRRVKEELIIRTVAMTSHSISNPASIDSYKRSKLSLFI